MAVSTTGVRAITTLALLGAFAATLAKAHEHHDEDIPEGQVVSPDPIDSILWIHIFVQIAAWGVLFPLGMVLGIIRSRWHVPVQTLGTLGAVAGYFLGHAHGGRRFGHNVHSSFAPWLNWLLFSQVVLGAYLRLHLERGFLGKIRPLLVTSHGIIGKALPIATWVQFLFGGIVAVGFCRGDHLGQCLAHFIMGSAFVAYGIILTILLLVGQMWLRRTGRSQEFFDSVVIAAWGCVNTFTEHRWGTAWVRNDLQHTSMGVIWWCAGLVGIWLSRKRSGAPKRNLIPGIVILLTGYGMSAHPQELMLSTMIHSFFGYTLMAAGATRIVEISFVLKDKNNVSEDGSNPNSFQFLPPFLLIASGFLFMGATEEQMALLSSAHVTHVSYILLIFSLSFLLFLFANMLIHIYAVHAFPDSAAAQPSSLGDEESRAPPHARLANGYAAANGHAAAGKHAGPTPHERRRARDAHEFELDSLISDDDDDEERSAGGVGGKESVRL